LIFWVAAVFLLPVSPIWPPRRPFLPYGRPNLALAGILVLYVLSLSVFIVSYVIASNHMFTYKLNACTFVTCSLNVID